jgi:DnaJ-domain-containing protein 1
MSFEEIAVVVLCLVAGYGGMAFLMDRRKAESVNVPRAAGPPAQAPIESLAAALAWPVVLGVAPDASIEQIQRAYEMRIAELHLDKAAAFGSAARDAAASKSREIRAAYDEACRARRTRA